MRCALQWAWLTVAIGAATCFGSDAVEFDSTWLYVHGQKQFFFDDLIIESIQNLTRRAHSPQRLKDPLIQSDRPWEHVTYFTCNAWRVLRDPVDGLMKCWYEDWGARHDKWREAQGWYGGTWKEYPSRCLYAYSKDGLKWVKPELGIVIEDGHNTNIVFGDKEFGTVHAPFVLLDPFEEDPRHRYKMLFEHNPSRVRFAGGDDPLGVVARRHPLAALETTAVRRHGTEAQRCFHPGGGQGF